MDASTTKQLCQKYIWLVGVAFVFAVTLVVSITNFRVDESAVVNPGIPDTEVNSAVRRRDEEGQGHKRELLQKQDELIEQKSRMLQCQEELIDKKAKMLKHTDELEAMKIRVLKREQELLKSRSKISIERNAMQQQLLQAKCKQQNDNGTIETGGWCGIFLDTMHLFDQSLAEVLARVLQNKTVVSFGEGPGHYKAFMMKSATPPRVYDAYDGGPFTDTKTNGHVKFLDLSLTQYGLPSYDVVVCLEVMEHIPAQYEAVAMDNLVRHARDWLILSWAVVGQQGLDHVNGKNFPQVLELMNRLGFRHEQALSHELRTKSSFSWFQSNVNVYKRIEPQGFDSTET